MAEYVLTVNSDLNWTTRVNKLCTALKQSLGFLRGIKYKGNFNKLQMISVKAQGILSKVNKIIIETSSHSR